MGTAWSVPGVSGAEPFSYGGTVYVRRDGTVRALGAATGTTRWTAAVPGTTSPAFAADLLWVAENDLTCSLVALDPASGARLQTVQIGGPAVGGPATAECTASDVTVSGASVVASVSYRLGTPQAGGCTLPPATAIASGPVAVDSAGGGA